MIYNFSGRIVEGTDVIQEVSSLTTNSNASIISDDHSSRYGTEPRGVYHTAPITDLNIVQANKCYLVSSSADGIINVWK